MAGRSHASPTTARTLARTRCTSLFSLLDHGATALIGLNDHYAREFQMALEFAGITVPGRCSIVGIDNHAQTAVFGLSTIDVGFDRLGYLAAHHLIGDVPIAIGRHGSVTSLSRLIDRGSLA
jgi:DNA-binding LacI/PurR family transcriptional regulator